VQAQKVIAMSPRISFLIACGLLGTAVVTGCTGGPGPPRHVIQHHVASRATLPPPQPVTRADARQCPETVPSRVGPPGVSPSQFFGWGSDYGNGRLWVGGLGLHGVLVAPRAMVGPSGSIDWKFGWWRQVPGYITITGRRLDAPAPPLQSTLTRAVDSGYGSIGFQASGVSFPTEGCWQVTGKTAHTSLTFVTFVIKKTYARCSPATADAPLPTRVHQGPAAEARPMYACSLPVRVIIAKRYRGQVRGAPPGSGWLPCSR
jgi:hypothetical protein